LWPGSISTTIPASGFGRRFRLAVVTGAAVDAGAVVAGGVVVVTAEWGVESAADGDPVSARAPRYPPAASTATTAMAAVMRRLRDPDPGTTAGYRRGLGLTGAGGGGSIQFLGRRIYATLVGVAALFVLPLSSAHAAPPIKTQALPFGHWVRFGIGAKGTYDLQGVFTFTSAGPVRVRVADGLCRGDRYRVLDHGRPVFQTSNVAVDQTCMEEPFATTGSEGWHDPGYSRGEGRLGPGSHRIRIRSTRSPFGGSTAWVEVLRIH
jgi:hypothetical protein